jgi:Nucleoside-diphosphate-sugar epimerases
VTGGAGFIGHHLVRALQDQGDQVLVIDDMSGGSAGGLRPETPIEHLDISRDDIAGQIAAWRPSIVFHLAAQVSVPRSMQDPGRDLEVNVIGTRRVLEAVQSAGVARVVFVSSGGAIYGETDSPATEETPPAPMSYYGAHKLLAEQYVRLSGTPYAIARPSNIYGPGQPAVGEGAVIAAFVAAVRTSSALAIHGEGTQRRDFLHVADLVSTLMLLGDHGEQGTWNVSSGAGTSVLDLARLLEELAGRPLKITHGDRRPGDINYSTLASDRIRRLGWSPRVSLRDGLRQSLRDDHLDRPGGGSAAGDE